MSKPPIRVVLADDHPLFRAGVRLLLERAAGIEIVGEASNGVEALEQVRTLVPDVVILDMEMPEMTGVEVARRLRAVGSPVRVLVLSAYDDDEYVAELLASGAAGYLTKDEVPERIAAAVRGVARGQSGWLSQGVSQRALRRRDGEADSRSLSPREREVLRLIADGLDNGTIAAQLFISENTVKNHVTSIFAKLEVTTRAEAVAWAWRNGLMGPPG
jgi:DNA-binding NarL/FixJ family response regulator